MCVFGNAREYHSILLMAIVAIAIPAQAGMSPYPASPVIKSITWDEDTHRNDAGGSDLWPTTWGADGHIYTSWGDGAGFGSDFHEEGGQDRVSLGFARIQGYPPDDWVGININGGKNAENPASFPKKGKCGGMLCVNNTLYAWLNLQDGEWPHVNQALAWSTDNAVTWTQASWVWPEGEGNFKAQTFLQFGKNYEYARDDYVYIYGRNETGWAEGIHGYLARVHGDEVRDRSAYMFFTGINADGEAQWDADISKRQPHFTDSNGVESINVVYDKALDRYIMTCHRGEQGTLGIFDGPELWGPWTTVAYYDNWLGLKGEGKGLHMLYISVPTKWISSDGKTFWAVYSGGLDSFNLIKGTLELREGNTDLPALPAQETTMSYTMNKVGVAVDKANIALFNSAICTHGDAVYIAFVQPDGSAKKDYQTVVGKFSEGIWKFSVVEPNSRKDPYHAQPSVAIDSDGYIHVTYNMHSSPWQYSVSASREDISRWEFGGQELRGPHDDERSSYVRGAGTADIPGNRITYQFMTVDRSGTPYVTYREALKTAPGTDYFEMQWSLGIARYDVRSRTWQRVGPDGGVFPFATEPGFRAQGGHIYFDGNNRMHVSWTWYAEYERDGSGHTKPNYPSYAYSDDGGITFNKADGSPLTLPVRFADSDIVIHPSWLEPNTEGYFYGYTQVCAMPDGTPYVWVMPKGGTPTGTGRAIIRYDASTGWSKPVLMPWGATRFVVDSQGVITAVSSGIRVHRSYDGGRTWKTWEIDTDEGRFHVWLDYSYARETDQLRFLAQRSTGGQLRVYTVSFSDD